MGTLTCGSTWAGNMVDWTTLQKLRGFFEVGYVFNRQLEYRYQPPGQLGLEDSFMLRCGLTF